MEVEGRTGRGPFIRLFPALLLIVLPGRPAYGQTTTLSGWVHSEAGWGVPGAAILIAVPPDTVPVRATETNGLGRFHVAGLATGTYAVTVFRLGFELARREVVIPIGGLEADFVLVERAIELAGLSVEVDRERTRFEDEAGATARDLTRDELKRLPGVAEADVLRAIEVLPGVVSTSDYTSAFNVRGGSADQNLILLDGFPIYNPFHLGGFFSVFNADVVSRAEMLAGGFPAEYGGRVSSVLTIESDATGAGTTVDSGVSLLAARAAVGVDVPDAMAGAVGLRTARARVSIRRSYFDQVLRPLFDFPYHLTDLQAFVEGWTARGSRLTLTAYTGRDVLDLAGTDSFPLRVKWQWGNDVVGLRHTAALGGGRILEAKTGFSRFSTEIRFPDFADTDFRSRIDQFTAGAGVEIPVGGLRFEAGVSADRLAYANLARTGGTDFRQTSGSGWLLAGWAQLRWDPGSWLFEAGSRLDRWSGGKPEGGGGEAVLAPRLAVKRFLPGGDVALKAAFGRYSQFAHSIRDEEVPLGIDVWVLSGRRAPAVISDQSQVGIEAFIGTDWYGSFEVYDRRLDGVVTNNFADDPNDRADDLIAGTGRSRGIDFYIRRNGGSVRTALAVSWLRARRRFADTSSGLVPAPLVEYAPIFDRRLDVEFTIEASLPGNSEAGLRWNFGTGLPYTRPLAGYTSYRYGITDARRAPETTTGAGDVSIVLGTRNAERYPAYHRLDVSVRRTSHKGWGRLTYYLDVVNVYNRKNPLFYFYEFDASPAQRSGISMFPLLPTFGVEVAF